jgi:hypothetical protein
MRIIMTKADGVDNTQRAPAPTIPNGVDDPIFALISEHKAAHFESVRTYDVRETLEENAPSKAKGARPNKKHTQALAVATKANAEAVAREDSIAIEISETIPTTLAGVAALLTYVVEHSAAGNLWPQHMKYRDANRQDVVARDFEHRMIETLAKAFSAPSGLAHEPAIRSQVRQELFAIENPLFAVRHSARILEDGRPLDGELVTSLYVLATDLEANVKECTARWTSVHNQL